MSVVKYNLDGKTSTFKYSLQRYTVYTCEDKLRMINSRKIVKCT